VIGAIVAGGRSTRFGGEPKGLRRVGGSRIIDRVATVLRGVCDHLVLIANDPHAHSWLASVRVERDRRAERGSIIGMHSALHAAGGDDVFVAAWDMPFLTTELVAELRRRLVPGTTAVVPESGRGLEPFCAAYSAGALPYVDAAIDAGEMRASRVIETLPRVARLAGAELHAFGDPARLFFNVNSAADLEQAERMAREG
jgi:molybdopterin-guanine dinucleotide biosynthesis protein A